jgi:MFS family permease
MTSLFQLAVAVAGPFFTIYLVQHLGASPFWVGLTAAASPLSATLCQPLIGRLADRYDPFRIVVISNLIIPLIPVAWVFVTDPWQVVFINLGGGALWAASQLASFKLLLELAPEDRLARLSAFNQGGMFLAGFLGPLIGAALIPQIGLPAVFVLSAAGRWLATGALWALNGCEAEPIAAVRRCLRIPRAA